ncbi:MAG TPA: ABC transporter substrate-binding protein [Actinomycetota bacterium]|nr:ABC transporter substrate-binding protein [Actinomycetota bacterium]
MKGLRRTSLTLAVATAVMIGLAGSALGQSATPEDEKITFNVGTTSDMVSANPFKACCSSEYEMLLLNYNMLYGFSKEDLSPVPELVEEPGCEPSEDYMTWTCQIRDDVTWHDGEPLTAADIAFTYRFILDNGLSTFSDYLPFNPTFEATDDNQLIWTSEEPTLAPTVPPYIPILPEHIWGPLDGQPAKEIRAFEEIPAIGSGPFQLTEWETGQFFRMEAVEGHFFGDPTIDEIVYTVFGNDEAMVQALKAGDIDYAYDLPPTLVDSLESEENIAIVEEAADYHTNLAFNFGGQAEAHPKVYGTPPATQETNHPALHDHAVRLAIAHAIDKEALAEVVFQGAAQPADTFISPDKAFWHLDIPAEEEYAFDLEEANRILDEAGYTERTAEGVRIDPESGEPLVLDIVAINNSRGSARSGELMAGWMEDIGIEFDVRVVSESKAYVEWENGTFDAYIWSWGGDPDPDFNMSIYTSDQCLGWSDGCYKNPELDQLYAEQRQTFDREARQEIVHEFQRIHYEEIPEIALVYPELLHAYRTDTFEGYVNSPTNGGAPIFAWRADSYMNLQPVTAGGPEGNVADEGGMSTGLLVAIGAVVVIAIAAFVVMGRRRSEEDEA